MTEHLARFAWSRRQAFWNVLGAAPEQADRVVLSKRKAMMSRFGVWR